MLRPLGIRDVVFDLGGVLIDWDPRYLLCDHLELPPEDVERFLATVCTPEWHTTIDAGRPFAAAAAELAGRFPEHREWIEAYCRGWHRMFAGHFPETVALLDDLAAGGYRLHALSNYPGEQIGFLYERFPFMAKFETVVLSGLVGATKPDPAIYRHLLARLDGRPALFVDDRAENVAAAKRCGLEALHVDGAETRRRLRDMLAP
ncbi:MAG TPA: HAD family phosphatase [Gammaproteobacteria bacterium]